MRSLDLVSGGFLALTAAGLVLLCSGLLAIAFSLAKSGPLHSPRSKGSPGWQRKAATIPSR